MEIIKFDINHAGIEELTGIPGFTQTDAQAIVNHRRGIGQFYQLDDLRKVDGLLENTIQLLEKHTWVGPVHEAEKTDINHACKNELSILPFVGSRNAEQIVTYRKLKGEFQSIDEVDSIPDIDESVKRMLKRYTRVCPEYSDAACAVA